MFLDKKDTENKKLPLADQVNKGIKNIARERLAKKNLTRTARKILEEIVEGNTAKQIQKA